MGRIVGIDLGTTNSVVAVMENGEPVVITLAEGSRLCPSVVGFSKTGERLVGQLAKRQAITSPDRTVASIKRHMGEADYTVTIDDKSYSPPEISAMILQKLKTEAEAYLGEPVDRAVVTVPAYFNDAQRQATKDAGRIAGLEIQRILNEPTSAALAYGMDKTDAHTILVWDLGGGTFDVSILELGEGVYEVRSTSGDTRLGGDDWDARLVDYLADQFQRETGVDLRKDKIALQRLREASEKAKIELSAMATTNVNLPFISTTAEGPVHLDQNIGRAQFEQITEDLRERMLAPTHQALQDAGLTPQQIDRVVLVGGSTRMPSVQEMVKNLFGKEGHKGTNPDEIVALGAAVQAGILDGDVRDLVLLDVTPLTLGLETIGGVMTALVNRNTTIPTNARQIFTTAKDGQTAVQVRVYQGERSMARDNNLLGEFALAGIPPAPRGLPKIEVTFEIDANGILSVSARDQATGREHQVVLAASSGLAKEEVDRMVREAEANARMDSERRQTQELRNQADSLLYSTEKTFAEAGERIDPSLVTQGREAAIALREALSDDAGVDVLQSRIGQLTERAYAVSAALYAAPVTTTVPVQTAQAAPDTNPDMTQMFTASDAPQTGFTGFDPDAGNDAGSGSDLHQSETQPSPDTSTEVGTGAERTESFSARE